MRNQIQRINFLEARERRGMRNHLMNNITARFCFRYNLFVLLVSSFIISCNSPAIIFTPPERKFIDFFKKGDTLYFKNTTGQIDTLYVSAVNYYDYVENMGFKRGKVHFKTLYVCAALVPSNSTFNTPPKKLSCKNILSITKKSGGDGFNFCYNFKNMIGCKSYLPYIMTDTLVLNGVLFPEYYEVAGVSGNRLFFDDNSGFIGYTIDSVTWLRSDLEHQ
jgi:hypothetical protein